MRGDVGTWMRRRLVALGVVGLVLPQVVMGAPAPVAADVPVSGMLSAQAVACPAGGVTKAVMALSADGGDSFSVPSDLKGPGNQPAGSFAHLPMHTAKGGRGLEQILPVVQIQHGITGSSRLAVTGRRPDAHEPRILKNAAAQFVQMQRPARDRNRDLRQRAFRFFKWEHEVRDDRSCLV